MKIKNLIWIFILTIGLSFVFTSCNEKPKNNSDQVVAKQTEQMMNESVKQVGLPSIVNWREKKDLKMIYELCDQESLICHAYLVNEINGTVGQYLGKCRGFGIPYSAQFSNPEKIVRNGDYHDGTFGTMPQPEPNGIFKPEGLSATWVLLIDNKGEVHPTYIEPPIIVSPVPLHEISK